MVSCLWRKPGKSSGVNLSNLWSGLEKAASTHPRALAAMAVAADSVAHVSSKSRFFFRWPVRHSRLGPLGRPCEVSILLQSEQGREGSPPIDPKKNPSEESAAEEKSESTIRSASPPPIRSGLGKREIESEKEKEGLLLRNKLILKKKQQKTKVRLPPHRPYRVQAGERKVEFERAPKQDPAI